METRSGSSEETGQIRQASDETLDRLRFVSGTPGEAQFEEYSDTGVPLLTLKSVSKSYGDKLVLKNVTAVIDDITRPGMTQGQVVAILGGSGVGKSTLLRLIAGLDKPSGGEILIGRQQKPPVAGHVGVVFQNYILFEDRTVFENIQFGAVRGWMNEKDASEAARAIAKRFDIADRLQAYPSDLSGGQRQRTAIAQQLLCSNLLLILDEPFSGLDPTSKDLTCKAIVDVAAKDEDMSVIVITHDIREALKVADEVWMLGRDREPDGSVVPGAYVKVKYDLKKMGLAWHADLTREPEFMKFEREVRDAFKTL